MEHLNLPSNIKSLSFGLSMEKAFIENKIFDKVDFTQQPLSKGDYEKCRFVNCNFSNANLSNCNFSECEFAFCNLSLAQVGKTAFRDIHFKDCKLLGLRFDTSNPFLFSVQFENCILNLSSFYKLAIKKTTFKNCTLHEVDFSEGDLTASVFENCDLLRATFDGTILDKVDFRTSYNYTLDPETNKIKKAKFSKEGIVGLLYKYDIEIE